MSESTLPRNNFFDGQEITENDMDVEQTAWHDSLANVTNSLTGSGVEQEFASPRVLFDTSNVPASVLDLISSSNFDGEPIYATDSLGLTVFSQPSDSTNGNQLDVEISGASLSGSFTLKVYIFGRELGDEFVHEVLVFDDNETQTTRIHFTKIIAIMTQDFKGNLNTYITGTASRNAGGRLRIIESTSMKIARDFIMAQQTIEPNLDYINFKPASTSKSLGTLLSDIADADDANVEDLRINTTATTTRELPPNVNGLIIAQKFKATTNNIQKVSLLLSVKENTLGGSGHEFVLSGDIVVGIRRLQTTVQCPVSTIPNTAIEFDPEPAPLAEVSFDQDELEELGITLNGTAREIDFVFTQSLLANPALSPSIVPGQYYMITIHRSGNISVGTMVLQEAANTDADPTDVDEKRMSVFSSNKWTDVSESDLWFKVYTAALRVTPGTAIDEGVRVTIEKTKENTTTGVDEKYIEGDHSFIDVSQNSENYVIVQKSNKFHTAIPHPSTGNQVFTRIEDVPDIAVVSETTLSTLIGAGNKTVVLGYAKDTNPVNNASITGRLEFPGLVRTNTITFIAPSSDLTVNNVVGSILVPNTSEPELKYRIIKQDVYDDAYGDITNNGTIGVNDVARAQVLDGYSKDLMSGSTLSYVDQRNAIVNGIISMEEIIRADVTGSGVVDIYDAQAIQQYYALGTAFDVGSGFKRVVLTVEDLSNPLTTTPNMVGADSSFNMVPFSPVNFRIDFVPLWKPENVVITDLRRFVPKTFSVIEQSDITSTTKSGGENVSFFPGDVLIGGDILDSQSAQYKIDFEIGSVIIELPEGSTQGEIDIFSNFIKNQMMFADGTLVGSKALTNNQVRATTAIQSFVKDSDGYDFESNDGYAAIDETIAVLYTQSSGILRVRAANIRNLVTRPEMRTKIVITVYLKKAGFRNTEEVVDYSRVAELLTSL